MNADKALKEGYFEDVQYSMVIVQNVFNGFPETWNRVKSEHYKLIVEYWQKKYLIRAGIKQL